MLQVNVPEELVNAPVLEGHNPADAQHEPIADDPFRLFPRAREAMEDTRETRSLLVLHDLEDLVEGISRVNDDGQGPFPGPTDLGPEGLLLLTEKCPVPIEIDPDLPYCDELTCVEHLSHDLEFLLVILFHMGRMKTGHQLHGLGVCLS